MLYYNKKLTNTDNDQKTIITLLLLLTFLPVDDLYFVVRFLRKVDILPYWSNSSMFRSRSIPPSATNGGNFCCTVPTASTCPVSRFFIVDRPGMKQDVAWHDLVLLTRKMRLECASVINYERHYGQAISLDVHVLIST
jgi:hypothetical protein